MPRNQKRAEIYALSAVILWSTVATAFKLALKSLSHDELLFWSLPPAIAAVSVIITIKSRWKEVFTAEGAKMSLIYGFFNPFLYYLILFRSYSLLPAQQAQPLNYTWAVMITLLSAIVLRQKLKSKDLLALLISFGGAFLIITGGSLSIPDGQGIRGVALALTSALLWALYWLFTQKDTRDESVKLFGCFTAGFIYLLIYMIFFRGIRPVTIQSYLPAVYVGLFEMGITFYLWSRAVHLAENTARVANLIFISPFLSFVMIAVMLGEAIRPASVSGLILITAGILLGRKKLQ